MEDRIGVPERCIFYSKTVTKQFTHVREVLQLWQKAMVTLKLAKCIFTGTAVSDLGHSMRPGELEVDRPSLVAIQRATALASQSELRSFLCM